MLNYISSTFWWGKKYSLSIESHNCSDSLYLTDNHLSFLFFFGIQLCQQRRCDSFGVFSTSESPLLPANSCYKNHLICRVMHCFTSEYFTFNGILICEMRNPQKKCHQLGTVAGLKRYLSISNREGEGEGQTANTSLIPQSSAFTVKSCCELVHGHRKCPMK